MVHDAARPCLSVEEISALINGLVDHSVGGLLALPVADTVKQVNPSGDVLATIDREGLWRAQTPQMFRLGLLKKALHQEPMKTWRSPMRLRR